ncbi:hypothetical protein QE152_g24315 [Popillia japonica]|uniref:Uncharacterized protein n=1 Tax=Popillia japonica TaxID=7064 RepID=A0AAW1KG47_POPJA
MAKKTCWSEAPEQCFFEKDRRNLAGFKSKYNYEWFPKSCDLPVFKECFAGFHVNSVWLKQWKPRKATEEDHNEAKSDIYKQAEMEDTTENYTEEDIINIEEIEDAIKELKMAKPSRNGRHDRKLYRRGHHQYRRNRRCDQRAENG